MRYVLVALAAGSIVAGFVGVPAALGGSNVIERFLEPSFEPPCRRGGGPRVTRQRTAGRRAGGRGECRRAAPKPRSPALGGSGEGGGDTPPKALTCPGSAKSG